MADVCFSFSQALYLVGQFLMQFSILLTAFTLIQPKYLNHDQKVILGWMAFIGFIRTPFGYTGVNRDNLRVIYTSTFFELITHALCLVDIFKYQTEGQHFARFFTGMHVLGGLFCLVTLKSIEEDIEKKGYIPVSKRTPTQNVNPKPVDIRPTTATTPEPESQCQVELKENNLNEVSIIYDAPADIGQSTDNVNYNITAPDEPLTDVPKEYSEIRIPQ